MEEAFDPLVLKLSQGAELSIDDRFVLEQAFGKSFMVGAHQDLIQEGQVPTNVHLVVEGFACRYKILPDGARQIVALMVPGDFCDLHVAILNHMDHAIGTITPCRIARLNHTAVLELTTRSSTIAIALWWATLVDEAVLREWLVGMGRRSADKQLAHLFCELQMRLQVVGMATTNSYDLPLSQADLSDILGLTPVHVNRMLQQLRAEGLITLSGRRMTIHDVPTLQAFAEFDPNYLHLKIR
jgi:CRP-like cAMP-binding protein